MKNFQFKNVVRVRLLTLIAVLLVSGFAYLLVGPKVSRVSAAGCSVASFNGQYGFLINTWTADPTIGASATTGVASGDGLGNISGSFTSFNANAVPTVQTGTFTGTYSVNPNCTGSISTIDDKGNTSQSAMVLTDGGSNVLVMQTDSVGNYVQTGTARKQ